MNAIRRRQVDPMIPVSIRLPRDVLDQIDQVAKDRGWTRSQWLAKWIDRGLQGEREQRRLQQSEGQDP